MKKVNIYRTKSKQTKFVMKKVNINKNIIN